MKNNTGKRSARVIFVLKSGCRRDPTACWENSTKKYSRKIVNDGKLNINGVTGKIGMVRENPRIGNGQWAVRFVIIGEHDLNRLSSIIKHIGDDIPPEEIALIGRRCFISKFRSEKDVSGSRYHWSGKDHPFGWLMYLDKDGEAIADQELASMANEIAAVFMANFEQEIESGRLAAAKSKA